MSAKPKKVNTTKANFVLDIILFFVYLIVYNPEVTGLLLHEWLGIGFGILIIIHLVKHWKWIVQITKRLFGKMPEKTRISYVLNWLLFIDIINIIFTGLMISGSVMPAFGLLGPRTGFWLGLHEFFASASIGLISAHLLLHWKWILNAAKRFMLSPLDVVGSIARPKPQVLSIQQKEI